MHVITIAFGAAPLAWQFVFKTEESAQKVWTEQVMKAGRVSITDDFGQTGVFDTNNISGRMIENLDLSKQAHVARSLHQQKMQAEFQKAAESDPTIRSAIRASPAVIQPFGMNGRG